MQLAGDLTFPRSFLPQALDETTGMVTRRVLEGAAQVGLGPGLRAAPVGQVRLELRIPGYRISVLKAQVQAGHHQPAGSSQWR